MEGPCALQFGDVPRVDLIQGGVLRSTGIFPIVQPVTLAIYKNGYDEQARDEPTNEPYFRMHVSFAVNGLELNGGRLSDGCKTLQGCNGGVTVTSVVASASLNFFPHRLHGSGGLPAFRNYFGQRA